MDNKKKDRITAMAATKGAQIHCKQCGAGYAKNLKDKTHKTQNQNPHSHSAASAFFRCSFPFSLFSSQKLHMPKICGILSQNLDMIFSF